MRAASLCAGLLLLLWGSPARAQAPISEAITIPLAYDFDLDSITYVSCEYQGQDAVALPGGRPKVVGIAVKTTGSSTTVAAVTATTAPFADLAAGDILYFRIPSGASRGQLATRHITAKTDDDTVTINSAIDLDVAAGVTFTWHDQVCGANVGWLKIHPHHTLSFQFQIDQIVTDGAGIDYAVGCKHDGNTSAEILVLPSTSPPKNINAVTAEFFIVQFPQDQCRLKFKIKTADDGTDTGAAAEKLSLVAHLVR